MKIRRASQEEEAMVRESLEAIEKTLYRRFLGDRRLGIVDGKRTEVVLIDATVFSLPAELREGAMGGLRVGIIDDGFAFDLQGAIIYARETRRQTVTVTEKAARLFLYSRDILSESVIGFDKSLKYGEHCIVTNPRHEALGIGRVVGRFKGSGRAVEAAHDLGSYLRDELHSDRGEES